MSDAAARLDLSRLPNFCAHEHWGSINSIGMSPESFRGDTEQGATPNRTTRLTDLLLDPYLGGFIWMAGSDPERLAREAGAAGLAQLQERSAAEAFRALHPALARQRLAGTYACLRRGLHLLYGIDPEAASSAELDKLDRAIGERYADLFGWYRKAMDRARFSALIRPVHPVYYGRKQSAETAAAEAAFTRTMLRIDPLLGFWRRDAPGRADVVRMAGEDPGDAAGWRRFIGKVCDLASAGGAAGIKQLQAYTRSLEFTRPSDAEVAWSGDLTEAQRQTFEDWVVHECCKQAHDRGWPHQVHVGTHNLPNSSPLPLASLAERYRRMKVVQIHAWPFLNEAAWLAKMHPNVYVDTNWLPVLSPAFYRDAVRTYLGFVPTHKIMAAHDSTSVEMAAGSSLVVREVLAEELVAAGRSAQVPAADLHQIAADILHNNAVEVYGPGRAAR
jgi:hypothetical protein